MPIDTNLLRPVAQPQPFNFAALQQSMLQGQARDTNLSAGGQAAAGDFQGAASTALRGGNPQLAGQMFDINNTQHAAALQQGVQKLMQINNQADWNKARAGIRASGGNDIGDFSQKDQAIKGMVDAMNPEAAANRNVQMAVLNKPQVERTVDPITGQVGFVRVGPYSGSAQPVGMGGGAPTGPVPSGAAPAPMPAASPPMAGAPPAGPSAAPPTAPANGPAFDPAVEDAIARIPQAYQGPLRGLLNYSVDPRLERQAGRGGLIAMAQQVDPTYNPSNFPARAASIKDATSGRMAQANNSLNTGIGHLDQLVDAVAGLNNGDFTPYNAAKNAIATIKGDPSVTNFKAVADRVAPEITRIWRGVGGSEADISRDLATLSTASSPQQLYGAIGNIAKMMQSKIDSNQFQYEQAVPGRPITMIRPEAEAVIAKLEGLANGQGAPPKAGAASAPPGGQQFQAGSQQSPLQVDTIDTARKLPSGTFFTLNGETRQVK